MRFGAVRVLGISIRGASRGSPEIPPRPSSASFLRAALVVIGAVVITRHYLRRVVFPAVLKKSAASDVLEIGDAVATLRWVVSIYGSLPAGAVFFY
jgi:hypothetical protein